MSWVKQGGEGEGWYWVDDGTGNPAVAGDNANNYSGGGGLLGTGGSSGASDGWLTANGSGQLVPVNGSSNVQAAGGGGAVGGWRLPGRGQFNNMPYESGPSDWRGIPFLQTDSTGKPLSKYQNAIDQLQASRQPISVGEKFARWNFGSLLPPSGGGGGGGGGGAGGGDWRWPGGTGNPPIAVDPSFGGGLLPPATTGDVGGRWGSGGSFTPTGTPPDPNRNEFGPSVPGNNIPAGSQRWAGNIPGVGNVSVYMANNAALSGAPKGMAWQNVRFANPTEGWQKNFNYLAGIDPNLAYNYALHTPGASVGLQKAVDALAFGSPYNPQGNSWSGGLGARLFGLYDAQMEPGSQQWYSLGLGDSPFMGSSAFPMYTPSSSGQTITYNGQTYTLPSALRSGDFGMVTPSGLFDVATGKPVTQI